MIKKLFYLFVFFAPFTSFFALSAWLRVPVVINQLLFIVLLISVFKTDRIKTKWIVKEDLFLLAFLVLVWISFMLGFREKRSLNHSLAYTNSILFYFFMIKYVVQLLKISSLQIARIAYWSFCLSSIIIITDFIGKNYFNVSIRTLFSEADGIISNMDYFIRSGFERVGGVAEEPGTMSVFYNIYFGISLYYLYVKKKAKHYIFIAVLFIASHFAMLSNAGIVLPIIAAVLIFVINRLKQLKISQKQLLLILGIATTLLISTVVILLFDIGNTTQFLKQFFDKIFFSETAEYSSSGQRLLQWKRALSNFIESPIFGNGPGFGVDQDAEGYLSVYLTILSDLGILALLFFLSFQETMIKKTLKLNAPIRSFLLFSVITSFLHLIIVADFYHAPLWILFGFIQLVYKEQKELQL
ncbi:O-antigen ligase family protein [Polaribacter uvawellassae]|uniref:O-antigen ligase family protein n=1 Tax=Polaribacter uvawellassae TaxID=3133495 RepID=UPI00321A0162